MEQLPQFAGKYVEKNVGRYWNYLFTPTNYDWPEPWLEVAKDHINAEYIIDGFSPNLNKSLHVGHLRQLALAKSLSAIFRKAKFVAFLGASLGVYSYAMKELNEWFEFVGYKPELYYDVLMPRDLVEHHKVIEHEAHVWDGPNGPVIVVRSDGRPTYAFHDLAFAKMVGPTHYITGAEQKEHFERLGLGDKHLIMGLVLGKDGKKMKSRESDLEDAKAAAVMDEIISKLDDSCTEKKKLAWNILAWNFLVAGRQQNVKYNLEEWTNPDQAGLYITYTYARVRKALKGIEWAHIPPANMKAIKKHFQWDGLGAEHWDEACEKWSPTDPDPQYDLTQADVDLLGFSEYYRYYLKRCTDTMDPTHMANYAHDLARRLGKAYHAEKIQGGRYGFQYAMERAKSMLRQCMWYLGMFDLEQV